MKHITLLFMLGISMFATTLLTYNTYDRENRVDIMLSFDTPYNGKVFLKKEKNDFVITLNDIYFDKTITKNLNSSIISQVKIISKNNKINIILKSKKEINIIASKTSDGFGLRLRAYTKSVAAKKNTIETKAIQHKTVLDDKIALVSSKESIDYRYYMLILILLILLLVLWYTKTKMTKNNSSAKWLFGNTKLNSEEIKILYRKPIDAKNSVILLSYKERKYLILTGSSNQLIDKFSENGHIEESGDDKEFEKIFAQNRQKLDEFLKVGDDKLSNYREKASLDLTIKDEQ